MPLRNNAPQRVIQWRGMQTYRAVENIDLGWWSSCNNVVVDNAGQAQVLRSPATFNTALATGNRILSAFDYPKNTGNLILYDIDVGGTVTTYSTTGGANTSVRTGQAGNTAWISAFVNDWAYRINGSEFIQTNGTLNYAVGITAPAAAPTESFVAGGAGSLAVGVTVSYAYRNSTTGDVGAMSPASVSSGASGGNLTLRTAVVASAQAGVDGIVLFITKDGGSVRYLYLSGSPLTPAVFANATGNIDISLALLTNLDILTPETAYNGTGPTGGNYMFRWKDRVLVCGFTGATTKQQVQFNVRENAYYGNPWAAWWPQNIFYITNKSDAARAGIETPIGALILGEQDAYLVRGTLSDAISTPQSVAAVTYQVQPMGWSIGTRSPKSLVNTPFGPIWFDQDKRLQLWPDQSEKPFEVGASVRTSLKAIQDTDAARTMVEGRWYAHGDQGGLYVLTASTAGSTNNVMFYVALYRDGDGNMAWAVGQSSLDSQSLLVAKVSGTFRLFAGRTDALFEIGDFTKAGAGWPGGTGISFTTVTGNDNGFSYFQSMMFDASDVTGLTVSVSDTDGSNSVNLALRQDTGTGPTCYTAMINQYGRRKLIVFTFSTADTTQRIIKNLVVNRKPTSRTT